MEKHPFVVAIYERSPFWGPELQRQFQDSLILVRECRVFADLVSAVAGFESALIVVQLDAEVMECLQWLEGVGVRQRQTIPIVVCGSSATRELEWQLREVGVTAFLPTPPTGEDFARLCLRLLGAITRSASESRLKK